MNDMQNNLGWTTLEQSKKLIEAGLDPNTADMFYPKLDEGIYSAYPFTGDNAFKQSKADIPCWSLGRLIELMPEIAMLVRDSTGKMPSYYMTIGPSEFGEDIFISEQYPTSIEAAAFTVIWLLANNYIKEE